MLHGTAIERIMMRGTVVTFIIKLRQSIIRRIIVTEESALDGIELHEITFDMGTDDIVGDASLLKGLDGCLQGLSVCSIDHILLRLRCRITSFQPVAILTLTGRQGDRQSFHDLLQTTAGTVLYAFRPIDDADVFEGFEPLEGFWKSGH